MARWPAVTAPGSECHQLTTLGDLMATCAQIAGASLPDGAGEDSVSILSLLKGSQDPTRAFAVHHSCNGRFAIRRDRWVFIDGPSGGDVKEPDWFREERGYVEHEHPGELYDLSDDIAERRSRRGRKGLWERLNSHASGRRSGDQFCVYICDRFIVPHLTDNERNALAGGTLSLDTMTRAFIREELSFRFQECTSGKHVSSSMIWVRKSPKRDPPPPFRSLASRECPMQGIISWLLMKKRRHARQECTCSRSSERKDSLKQRR